MARIILSANKAEATTWGTVAVVFDGKDHFPVRAVDVANTAEAEQALAKYAKDAEASGLSLNVSMRLARGERAPRGFRAAKHDRFVNLRSPEAEPAKPPAAVDDGMGGTYRPGVILA